MSKADRFKCYIDYRALCYCGLWGSHSNPSKDIPLNAACLTPWPHWWCFQKPLKHLSSPENWTFLSPTGRCHMNLNVWTATPVIPLGRTKAGLFCAPFCCGHGVKEKERRWEWKYNSVLNCAVFFFFFCFKETYWNKSVLVVKTANLVWIQV